MENKINIAEILKNCPKGMELECTMYDKVILDGVENNSILPIRVKREDGYSFTLTKYGQYSHCGYAKCVIFPTGKTTWEGFVPPYKFKDGDIAYTTLNSIVILKDKSKACYSSYCGLFGNDAFAIDVAVSPMRFATEEEKERLFKAIKDNGYKWDAETKTFEKLIEPKFKIGDKIADKTKFTYRITEITDKGYKLNDLNTTFITFEEADLYFVKVVDIFDITTLKPFDKVLARFGDTYKWFPAEFGHYDREIEQIILVGGTAVYQCIPYKGNEYLCGTREECDKYFKTWEE